MTKNGRFRPGVSGNPSGRPKVPTELRDARRLSKIEIEQALNRFLFMTEREFEEVMSSPGTTGLELMIGVLIRKGIDEGDHKCISFILDRLGFTVRNQIAVSGPTGTPVQFQFTDEQRDKIVRAYLDEYADMATVKD